MANEPAHDQDGNVTHLSSVRDLDPALEKSAEELEAAAEPSGSGEEGGSTPWWLALGALVFIGLVVVASAQYQRANALDGAVAGLNAQLQSTRGVLEATEDDLSVTRGKLGVYAERMQVVRGRVATITEQLGELGSLVSEDALPVVDLPAPDASRP